MIWLCMEFVGLPAIFSQRYLELWPNPGVGALTSGKTYSQRGEKELAAFGSMSAGALAASAVFPPAVGKLFALRVFARALRTTRCL
jgi:hypothetical protein